MSNDGENIYCFYCITNVVRKYSLKKKFQLVTQFERDVQDIILET